MMRNIIRLLMTLVVSGALLVWAYWKVDVDAMLASIKNINLGYASIFALSLIVIQLCKILRFDALIRPFATLSLRSLFRVSGLGLMLVLLLPLRLGEFARPFLLKQESGAPMSAGLGAVVVERVIDGLLVTLLFFVTTMWIGEKYTVPAGLYAAAWISLGIFSGATVAILLIHFAGDFIPRLLSRILGPILPGLVDKLVSMSESFIKGLAALANPRALGVFVGYTLVYWAANALGLWAMMLAFGWDLPPVSGFALLSIVVIAIMVPAGPGFLGTFQGAIRVGLAIFGVEATGAAAYSTLVYPMTLLVVIGFGLPFVFGKEKESVKGIISLSQAESE
ncbi:flippase-like domain-containing protein [Myxococcota bacterium]|nr:flippase-like domain-containing protein [Myxococcota bacterium]